MTSASCFSGFPEESSRVRAVPDPAGGASGSGGGCSCAALAMIREDKRQKEIRVWLENLRVYFWACCFFRVCIPAQG